MGRSWASLSPESCSAKLAFTLYQEVFPDLRYTIEEMIAEGDTVVTRVTFRATTRGPS
jgi:predicted ester cyclase